MFQWSSAMFDRWILSRISFQPKRDGKMQQLRFLTKRSYLNDRFQAQAYLKVSSIFAANTVSFSNQPNAFLPHRNRRFLLTRWNISWRNVQTCKSYYQLEFQSFVSNIDCRTYIVMCRWVNSSKRFCLRRRTNFQSENKFNFKIVLFHVEIIVEFKFDRQ